jgi:uncharacterized membrane protein YbjE (DUF340 family)
MLTIIGLLLSGTILGWLLKKRIKVIQTADRLLNWSIYLLLLLLGLGIGANPEIIRSIGTLGLQAAAISILSMAGSILAAVICYHWLFKK